MTTQEQILDLKRKGFITAEDVCNMSNRIDNSLSTARAAYDMINGYCAGKVAEELTRRDHFAMAAIQAVSSNFTYSTDQPGGKDWADWTAKAAWALADAMEKNR